MPLGHLLMFSYIYIYIYIDFLMYYNIQTHDRKYL